jgi:hypothetical protein
VDVDKFFSSPSSPPSHFGDWVEGQRIGTSMTLKFKRNLPILILLVGILSLMALTMGRQQIVSYTVNTDALPTAQLASINEDLSNLTALFSNQNTDVSLQQFSNVQP